MSSPPSGVVTFLFTDIEGSTRRWEADADGMRTALATHDEVLRKAVAAHDGWLFKHTGDGICAAFASPRSAVKAAVEAQRALELPVRIGVATGEAELRGDDYFGTVLNRAARVMAAGHGGQILLADSTASLLSGSDLIDLGPRRLRDLPTPVGVYQVRAVGLRTDFPPLETVDVIRGNLRQQATSFIGRETELDEVAAALRDHRLVTLTGVGGVGKTRLALEVAARLTDKFPDGAWVFELAAVIDPAALPDAVASVLGVTQQPGKSMTDSVADALEGRVRLLVFDNCEHLLDAAADLIEAILTQSATVRVLATSREGMGVADEQAWPVPTLDVASRPDSAAVTLFVERARAVAPRFATNTAAVAEICQRLDGIPLAIELAASRMASMTLSELANRLDQRFRLLVRSRRGLNRHQTLRHMVAWSYELLDEQEWALLDCCSVFAGGFDLESACAVLGSDDPDDYAVLDRLDALVRKSLLVADLSSGRTRYSMLETIRQFAEERLVERGSATAARAAHARHFASMETAVMAQWDSPKQRYAYTWFAAELANLRAAFRWSADHGDLDVAATIATYAWLGLWVENYEPIAWAEELIEPARVIGHPRLLFLYVLASQCWNPGRIEEAVRFSDAGQLMTIATGSDEVPFGAEGVLCTAYMTIGQPERMVDWCRAELARGRDTHGITRTALVIGLMTAGSGDEARAVANGLIETAEATRNPCVLSFALWGHGYAFRDVDPAGALASLRRGLVIAQDSGNRFTESRLASTVSRLEPEQGDPVAAFDHLALAIRNYHDSGNTTMIRSALAILAAFLERLGYHEPAAIIAGFALSPLTAAALQEFSTAIAHLRAVLGDRVYESLARKGESMTTAEMARYAYDKIHHARAEVQARE